VFAPGGPYCGSPVRRAARRSAAALYFRHIRPAPRNCVPRYLGDSMTSDTPVLDTLADIIAASLEHNTLPPRELMLVRIAALIAVDAPPASYLANAGPAADSGVTGEDIQAVMIGVAPVVGTPKIVSSAGKIGRALGFEIMAAEAALADDEDAGD